MKGDYNEIIYAEKYGKNHDNQLSLEEFKEGSKHDPKIVQALTLYAP